MAQQITNANNPKQLTEIQSNAMILVQKIVNDYEQEILNALQAKMNQHKEIISQFEQKVIEEKKNLRIVQQKFKDFQWLKHQASEVKVKEPKLHSFKIFLFDIFMFFEITFFKESLAFYFQTFKFFVLIPLIKFKYYYLYQTKHLLKYESFLFFN